MIEMKTDYSGGFEITGNGSKVSFQDDGSNMADVYTFSRENRKILVCYILEVVVWVYYCDQIERWILNLNFPGFSKLKIFFSISW